MAQPFVFMSELKRQDFEIAFATSDKTKVIFLGWEFVQIITYIMTTAFSISCPLSTRLSSVFPVLCDWVFTYFQK